MVQVDSCPLCMSSKRKEIEAGIRDSTYSKSIVARELSMTTSEVYHHMMHHADGEGKLTVKSADITMDKKQILWNALFDLNERFSKIVSLDDNSPNTTKQIVALAGELRNAVMNIAKLEGEIEKEQQVTIIMYNEFKSHIMNIMHKMSCPHCGKALSQSLMEELSKFNEKELVA